MLLKKIRLLKLFSYLFFTIFFISCYIIPCDLKSGLHEFNEKKENHFFVGKYIVEKSFNNRLKTSNSTIELKKDGTIEMIDIPVNIFDLMKHGKEINVRGTWKQNFLENNLKDRYYLPTNLKFDERDNIESSLRTIKVYAKTNKPVLLIEFGDPDECNGIRFIKKT